MITDKSSASLLSIKQTWQRLMTLSGDYGQHLKKNVFQLFWVNVLSGISLAGMIPLMMALIDDNNQQKALLWLIIISTAFVLSSILRWWAYDFYYNGHMFHLMAYLRSKVGQKLRRIPLQSIQQNHSGNTSFVLLAGISSMFYPILTIVDLFFKAIIMPISIALLMFFYDARLALLLLLIFPLLLPFFYWLNPKVNQSNLRVKKEQQQLSAEIIQYIQGINILRSCRQNNNTENNFLSARFQHIEKIQSAETIKSVNPAMLMSTTVEMAIFAIVLICVAWFTQGSLSLAVLIATLIIIIRLGAGLSSAIYYTQFFDNIKTVIDSLEQIFAEQELAILTPTQIPVSYEIVFDDVNFQYEANNEYGLNAVSVVFPEKKLTAIVGPSGSGKTTLIKLIQRFADPKQGKITIGGIDIRQIETDVLANLIAVVFQDVYLFNQSILANIRMSKPEASIEEVKVAAKLAYCDEFIERLPDGYNTKVGDIGASLSGGERQRISIARAILKNAPIIILDEPTSSLDAQSEYWVQKAIDHLLDDKTIIVISHRMSTIIGADQILLLDQGKIVEQGNHQQLLALNGLYQRLYQLSTTTVDNNTHIKEKTMNKPVYTPVESEFKQEWLEGVNYSGNHEFLLFVKELTPFKLAQKAELIDIYQEGALIRATEDLSQEMQEYFISFEYPDKSPMENIMLLFMAAAEKHGLVAKPTTSREFTLVAKKNWAQSFVRISLNSSEILPATSPAYITAFDLGEKQSRVYTYRRINQDRTQIDVDIFTHGTTPTIVWLDRLTIADKVITLKEKDEVSEHLSSGQALLCGDETAFPAIAAILEHWQNPEPPLVLVEMINEQDLAYFDDCILPANTHIQMIKVKDKTEYGKGTVAYLQEQQPPIAKVWGAYNNLAMRLVKKYLEEKYALTTENMVLRVYWAVSKKV